MTLIYTELIDIRQRSVETVDVVDSLAARDERNDDDDDDDNSHARSLLAK